MHFNLGRGRFFCQAAVETERNGHITLSNAVQALNFGAARAEGRRRKIYLITPVHRRVGTDGRCYLDRLNLQVLPEAFEDATAVIFRTGSGDRLTSRCCREITLAVLPFLLVQNLRRCNRYE